MAIAGLVVFVMPGFNQPLTGSIVYSDKNGKVEGYGPELPAGYNNTLTILNQEDNSVLANTPESDVEYFYCVANGTYYHKYTCTYAYATSKKLTAYEAYYLGYKPCPKCNPTEYVPANETQADTAA